MAGDPDAALPARRLRRAPRSTPPASATAPTASATAPPTSPATSAARRTRPSRSTTTRRPIRATSPLAGGEGWRRVDDFDLSWANPDQGPASPIGGASWRITGPAGYDTGVKFAAGPRHRRARRPLRARAPAPTRSASGCATKPATRRRPRRVEVPLRFDDVPPGVAFDAERRRRACPSRSAPTVTDAHSGPAGGTISYRRLDADELDRAADQAAAGRRPARRSCSRRMPATSAPAPTSSAPTPPTAPATRASTTLRADGTEMALRKTPPPVAPAGAAGRRTAKTRLFARLRGGHGRGDALTVPFGAPALLSGRLTRADGAGLAGRELRVVSRPSRGALAAPRVDDGHDRRRTAASSCALPAGPSRRITVAFPGDARPRRRQPALAGRCGCARGISLGAAPLALQHRPGRAAQRPGRAAAARRSRGAASWSRSSTSRRRPHAGARCWSPAPTTAAASAPATASATSAAPPRSACGRRRWPRSAGPTRPAPRARSRSASAADR